jgi:hypothetical protein
VRVFNLILIIVIVTVFTACIKNGDAKINDDLIEVWTGSDWPPKDMDAPESFSVSPWEAFQIAAKSKRISLKHKWICYRDDQSYYIADSYGKRVNAITAFKYGLKINGITGEVEN